MHFIVKNTTFPGILDLLAPPSCRGCEALGSMLCDRCKNDIIFNCVNYCPNCRTENPTGNCPYCHSLPPTFIVGERSNLLGNLVHDLKYHANRNLARPLAAILDATLPQFCSSVSIVPLPTIRRHIRERGIDHTLLISQHLAQLRGENYQVAPILIRSKNTVQVGADEETRQIQALAAYSIKPNTNINPENTYLLFDDVWTTGASLRAAYKTLRQSGAKKIVISVLSVNHLDQR